MSEGESPSPITKFTDKLFKWALRYEYINPKTNKKELELITNKFVCYCKHDKRLAQELFPKAKNPVIVGTIMKLWFPDIYLAIHDEGDSASDYNNIDLIIDDFWISTD